MRILSQCGLVPIDLPYDMVVLEVSVSDNSVFANTGTGHSYMLARYSDVDKVEKALKALRNTQYESEFSKACNDGSTYLSSYFQFPTDIEMEKP